MAFFYAIIAVMKLSEWNRRYPYEFQSGTLLAHFAGRVL